MPGEMWRAADLPPVVHRPLHVIRATLEASCVGVHLFGSAVVGGLRRFSDIDLLVLVRESVSDAVRRRLVTALLAVSGAPGSALRPLEVTVLRVADVVPWRYPPRAELVFGEWLRADFEAGRIGRPEPDPDLAVVLKTARDDSVALFGPPLAELLAPVPIEDVRRAMREAVPELVAGLRGDERNVLLTLARMWVTLEEGVIVPKDVAAERVARRLPESLRAVLDEARAAYLGECEDTLAARPDGVAALAACLRRRVEAPA